MEYTRADILNLARKMGFYLLDESPLRRTSTDSERRIIYTSEPLLIGYDGTAQALVSRERNSDPDSRAVVVPLEELADPQKLPHLARFGRTNPKGHNNNIACAVLRPLQVHVLTTDRGNYVSLYRVDPLPLSAAVTYGFQVELAMIEKGYHTNIEVMNALRMLNQTIIMSNAEEAAAMLDRFAQEASD
ncbi:TPA: hypothetical protein HA241_00675 [Candidatus Woesearchaeota archaeon]|nr:hypothetical protein [Candidatus Woesearchaeota archaeon]